MIQCQICHINFDVSGSIDDYLVHQCFDELTAESRPEPSPKVRQQARNRQSPRHYQKKRAETPKVALDAVIVSEMYNRPLLVKDIARGLEVSERQVRNCLKSLNLPHRSRSEVLTIMWAQGKYLPTRQGGETNCDSR